MNVLKLVLAPLPSQLDPFVIERFIEPTLDAATRARVRHDVFLVSRGALLRRIWRAAGFGCVVRFIIWRGLQAVKITFGIWDNGALLSARVLPRAAVLTPHRLECVDVPVGLQMHQVKTRLRMH